LSNLGAVQFRVAPGAGGRPEAALVAPGETHTIGELLRRAVYDTHPEVAFAAYSVSVHERRLTLTVRADDPAAVITEAAAMAIATFDEIHRALLAL
jgi:DNA-directed RNA polymerase subunit L